MMCYQVRMAQHEVVCLWHRPLILHNLVIFIVQLQHTLLDIHTMFNYFEIIHPLLKSLPSKPIHANPTWMRCFISNTQICDELYMVGVPIWLCCNQQFISPTMNIVNPVQLTFPDHIVKVTYLENRVAKPFRSLFHGPGGVLHHYHTCQAYQGTLDEAPEPVVTLHQEKAPKNFITLCHFLSLFMHLINLRLNSNIRKPLKI